MSVRNEVLALAMALGAMLGISVVTLIGELVLKRRRCAHEQREAGMSIHELQARAGMQFRQATPEEAAFLDRQMRDMQNDMWRTLGSMNFGTMWDAIKQPPAPPPRSDVSYSSLDDLLGPVVDSE